jgi:predicted nucleotide-binding protein
MASESDIFKKINDSVLDLQSSGQQTYERPLKTLGRLLQDPVLAEINREITKDVDLEKFLEESERTQGGMVGSARLLWPDDPKQALGLTYLLICKFGSDPEYMFQFGFNFYYAGKQISSTLQNVIRQLILPFSRDYKNYVMAHGATQNRLVIPMSNKVFVVHGHDEGARESVARFLEKMDFQAIILHEQANQGRTVIEKVEAHGDVGFAVVLLTPDDEGCTKGKPSEPRARQNVLLELGYFIGRLGRERVCALKRGEVEIPSDFAGMVWVPMDSSSGWKLSLAKELKAAGYHVDMNKVISF